jgi:hypothetical protein
VLVNYELGSDLPVDNTTTLITALGRLQRQINEARDTLEDVVYQVTELPASADLNVTSLVSGHYQLAGGNHASWPTPGAANGGLSITKGVGVRVDYLAIPAGDVYWRISTGLNGTPVWGTWLRVLDSGDVGPLRDRSTHTGSQAMSTITGLTDALNAKQDTLVNGTNIKSLTGTTLLGSGNLVVPLLGTATSNNTANFTAAVNTSYNCDTSAASFTVTLPASPANGTFVGINDAKLTFATNPLTVARNGQLIEGVADDIQLDVSMRGGFLFRAGYGWTWV